MRVLAALALSLTLLAACDSGPDDASGVGDLVLALDVLTDRPPGGVVPVLALQTVEEYGCANSPLVVVSDVRADRLTVSVKGVSTSTECFPALTPASTSVRLPYEYDAPGYEGYRIEIEKDGDWDTYVMERSGTQLLVTEVEASFSSFLTAVRH